MTSSLSPAPKTSRRKADSTFDNICLKFAGPRKSSSLPVSKKFYADILERVIVTSLLLPESEKFARQTMDLIDTYLRTHKIHLPSQPKEIQLIFAVILPEIDRALTRSERAREKAEKRRNTAIENLPESRSERARERAEKRRNTAIENLPESRSGQPSESTKIHPSATTFSASDSTPEISSRPSSGQGKIAPATTLSFHQNSTGKGTPETSSETTKISPTGTLSSPKNSIPESTPLSMEISSPRKPEIDVDKEMDSTPHTQKSGADEEPKSAENLPSGQASPAGGFPLRPALTRRERRRLANAGKRAGKLRLKPLGKA